MPEIADYLQNRVRLSADEAAFDVFSRELISQRRTGFTGPLLKLYAGAHGIWEGDKSLRLLAANVPTAIEQFRPNLSLIRLVDNAIAERQFYCASPTASAASADTKYLSARIPEAHELPSTAGFALLQSESGGGQILMWSHVAGSLNAAMCDGREILTGTNADAVVTKLAVGSRLGDSPAHRAVLALAHNLRQPTSWANPADHERLTPLSGRLLRKPDTRVAARPPAKSAEDDYVALVYGPSESREGEPFAGTRNAGKTDKRWLVRGHMRNQWYPSKKAFIPIWIEAHESGAPDGIFIARDRVKIAR